MTESSSRLRISEIFFSLQGESTTVGCPTVFIRLTGCPLRCVYCDTSYAFTGGEWLGLDQIMQQVKQYPAHYITVTGGEPLAQKACFELLSRLCDEDYKVSIETSGALDISSVDSRVKRVMDLKTPASGECEKNLYQNVDYLGANDEVKFVISNRDDYQWSKAILEKYQLNARCEILFSPVHGDISATDLANWIIEDGLAVRFQVQLHKYLWGDKPGH